MGFERTVVLAELGRHLKQETGDKKIDPKKTPFAGIGDISLKDGGRILKHTAHQTGTEADVFYVRSFENENFKLEHRWKRSSNRFPEKMVTKGKKLNPNFDVLRNFNAFGRLQSRFGVWITTDSSVIEGIKKLRDKVESKSLDFFLENSQHSDGHEDHFHVGVACLPSQPHCKNEWGEWHRLKKAGKKWKFQFGKN